MDVTTIKALTFDVFGTVVDWRGSVIRELEQLGRDKDIKADWPAFADTWRTEGYLEATAKVRRGELPWMNTDQLHRRMLDELLARFGLTRLSEAEKEHLNRVWHRLASWPDAIAGLKRLRKRYVLATLSNGNMALLTNMAKNAGLPWDCILSSELIKSYKTDPKVYQMAADLLGLPTDQVMMVAAHKHDLKGAQAVGMKLAFVPRPKEWGRDTGEDLSNEPWLDVYVRDFTELAKKLGT